MKKYFLLIASVLLIIFHSFRGFNFIGLLLVMTVVLGFLLMMKEITEFISRRIEASKDTAKKVQRRAQVLYRMSQLPPEKVEQFFQANENKEEQAKVYHFKPRLGLVQFTQQPDREPKIHDITYESENLIADMRQAEDHVAILPADDRKLVIFVSEQRPSLESELLTALKKNERPDFAIQKEILPQTDFLELSTEAYLSSRLHLRKLVQRLGNEYQHYVYFYPNHIENVYSLNQGKRKEEDFDQI